MGLLRWCCKQHDIACRYMAKYEVNGFELAALSDRGAVGQRSLLCHVGISLECWNLGAMLTGFWPFLAAAGLSVTLVALAAVVRMRAAKHQCGEAAGFGCGA